jgi:glycosyltransferase involved in cell wall biosynthesis
MSEPVLSVIIPTYNREATLCRTLDALLAQNPKRLGCEILVVDDGSTDGTRSAVQSRFDGGCPIRLLACPHRGPAAARNAGVEEAGGRLLLFTGDDMIAPSDYLQRHLAFHASNPSDQVAVVGDVQWHSDLVVTPLMHWLIHGGPYFEFHTLVDGDKVDHRYFITANLSLKRAALGDERFDETLVWAAFEDVELGYRLVQGGLRLLYSDIPVYHLHPVTLEGAVGRMYNTGRAACCLLRKWPAITGTGDIQHPRLYALFKHERLSAGVNRCVLRFADWLGVHSPVLLYRYALGYARWRGYVDECLSE